jgi:superoxide dismutase
MTHELPPLPNHKEALEPHIDALTMEISTKPSPAMP